MCDLHVSGGIILAPEGINGSLCGTRDSVEKVITFIQTDDRLKGLRRVESPVSPEEEAIHHGHRSSSPLAAGEDAPFRWDHVRVKLKKEIVTLGMPSVSPVERVGKYISPKEWNALISDPDTVVIDVRNDYETRIGKFKRAIEPCTTAFREFPNWVEEQSKLVESKDRVESAGSIETTEKQIEEKENKMPPRVAMYCTGGIRCEKATSFLLSKGVEEMKYVLDHLSFIINNINFYCIMYGIHVFRLNSILFLVNIIVFPAYSDSCVNFCLVDLFWSASLVLELGLHSRFLDYIMSLDQHCDNLDLLLLKRSHSSYTA